ncbi:MAG TPA: 2,5-diamino-6-(ribosylamino)-4(3H)-pyrimidinone 5'-phosphate reductase [Candidatus Bathyarchaeia archaeon]|nr:2,5-diamino-6-(ribosylamino)-4(3H)-pyrimidinone 5'-phosphate reductase [Candidatus Bathyarchaeia archaeon]
MPSSRNSRPYVILNAAMSLDGKIATYTGDSRMSSPADLRRVHRLRASVDGIMVGMRTLLRDDPKLTVKFARGRKPHRIIVDSTAQTPLTSYVVRTASEIPTIVAVTSRAPKNRIETLERRGVKVFVCGKGPLVSVKTLLQNLRNLGIRKILLEGGGALNWSMLSRGFVDEVSVAITPRILGGEKAVSLVEGKGAALVKDDVKLKLLRASKYGPDLVVLYKVQN